MLVISQYYYEANSRHAAISQISIVESLVRQEVESFYNDILDHGQKLQRKKIIPFFSSILSENSNETKIRTFIDKNHIPNIQHSVLVIKDVRIGSVKTLSSGVSFAIKEFLSTIPEQSFYLSPILKDSVHKQLIVIRLYSKEDKELLYVGEIDLALLITELNSIIKPITGMEYVISSSGELIFSSLHSAEKDLKLNYSSNNKLSVNSNSYYYSSVGYPIYKLYLEILLNEETALISSDYFMKKLFIVYVSSIIVLFIIGTFFSQSMIKPLQSMISRLRELGKGRFSEGIRIKTNDEFEELSEQIDSIMFNLKKYNDLLDVELKHHHKELSHARKQIQHQEKMINIGMLAAGVAHEIGNPLTSISNLAQVLKRKMSDEKEKLYLDLMINNIERIDEIVKNLVDFARPIKDDINVVRLSNLIDQALKIVKFDKKGKKIRYTVINESKDSTIETVEGQLLQVLVNILFNAVDAVDEKQGEIKIITKQNNDEVVIKIIDNGSGIPQEIQEKIFDPFFTTKEVGKGTGLGLAVSYSIIQNLKGHIDVVSDEGKGSEFILTLPLKTPERDIYESKYFNR
ncbi:MAG: hypothetical protein Kow00108_07690 [Calditrichia bacterium]